MQTLEAADAALFRFINLQLSHPLLDQLMPHLASHPLFIPAVVMLAVGLWWKGGLRGRLFVGLLALTLALGDTFVINTLKHAFLRARPYLDIPDANLLVGRGRSGSFPSSHVATWFAATLVTWVFYRKSWRFMLPAAVLMAFSRVYLGAHYPSDVLGGALLGAGYAAAVLIGAETAWRFAGRRFFPAWAQRVPSLLRPELAPPQSGRLAMSEAGWLRLGYALIGVALLARWLYLAAGKIELSEDEAYQWLWSKHLAMSYYSKPPLIAYAQSLGTTIWGDTTFGVRFLSPLLAAIASVLLLRWMSREINARAAFWLVFISYGTPLLAVGSILLTIDPLLVLFWTGAMIAGWKAVQPQGTSRDWFWAGLWAGLGFLSKYSALFLFVCWGLFFLFWRPARVHLRRAGPYVALGVAALCAVPVLVWNAQHGWITVEHVATNAKLEKEWHPTLRYLFDFVAAEGGLLNPIFLGAALWAMVAIWRRPERRAWEIYVFCLGAPVFLGYCLYTLHSRVLPNWIAPAVLPMFALMVAYFDERDRSRSRVVRRWLGLGMVLGLTVVIFLHDTNMVRKLVGRPIPVQYNPLRRVRAWSDTAKVVAGVRERWIEEQGGPVFVIGGHYGITSQLAFYWPDQPRDVRLEPLVYYVASDRPKNQFFFWPHYRYTETRRGQNALFVQETDVAEPPPKILLRQFESVEDLGLYQIKYRGQVFHTIQLFACRSLQ